MPPSLRSLAVLGLLLASACHGTTTTTDAGPPAPLGPHPLYASDAGAPGNPFPDDRLVLNGQLTVRDNFWQDYLPQSSQTHTMATFQSGNAPSLATVAGHGNSGFTLVRVSDALDPASLAGHVFFAEKVNGAWTKGPDAVAQFVDPGNDNYFVAIRAATPLANGQPAALVLAKGLMTADGTALVRPPDFDTEAKSESDLAQLATALGLNASDVLLKLDLAVQDSTKDVLQIAAWAGQDAPVSYTLHTADGGNDLLAPLGVWTGPDVSNWSAYLRNGDASRVSPDAGISAVGTVALGTFDSHDLRDFVYDSVGNVISAGWKPDWIANPDGAPTTPLHFVLTLPTPDKKVNGKYRVMIVAHGLGSRNTFDTSPSRDTQTLVGALAVRMAENGIACIGIDDVDHGTRGNYLQLFDMNDIRTTRENFRQTTADLLQLSRLVPQLDVDGDGQPDLDASDIAFFGNSLGSIEGEPFLATDHRVKYGVLNVPTGGLGMMFLTDQQAPTLHFFVGALIASAAGVDIGKQPAFDQTLLVFSSEGQTVFEPADPFDYAALLAQKHVLAQEGVGDKTLPNVNTDELFAGAQLAEVTAPLDDAAGVSGFTRVTPSDYGITDPSFDPHSSFFYIPQVQAQAVDFLVSHGTSITPIHP
ncbi:MAG: hypothetical protein JST54_22030 [Deltaproteobacteria bacterium]|nr:hypothetical protein [Deltaproteobacteria bacterium]